MQIQINPTYSLRTYNRFMSLSALFLSVFIACAVEAVEATTIVLAAGTARDWRSALQGVGAGLGLLGLIILVIGPSISLIPIDTLRIFVGVLLLSFGLQWLRKAILRSSGFKALHDEDEIYRKEIEGASSGRRGGRFGVDDWYAFTLSFKGVLLEGLEVVFIVLTFGVMHKAIGLASLAALSAVVIVSLFGFILKRPLAQVPENSMKFVVGVMLTSFGIFWGAEGAGAMWPHGDGALLAIVPSVFLVSYLMVIYLKSRKKVVVPALKDEVVEQTILKERGFLLLIKEFGWFWWDFIVGDDVVGFVGILLALLVIRGGLIHSWWVLPVAVVLLLGRKLLIAVK